MLLLSFLSISACEDVENKTGNVNEAKKEYSTKFEQIGYFQSDKLRGFTYFIDKPNLNDIGRFCEEQKNKYTKNRVLKIHFYDDLNHTPDITLNYYFPESSEPYLIADYFFNPFNGKEGLKIHKSIPD